MLTVYSQITGGVRPQVRIQLSNSIITFKNNRSAPPSSVLRLSLLSWRRGRQEMWLVRQRKGEKRRWFPEHLLIVKRQSVLRADGYGEMMEVLHNPPRRKATAAMSYNKGAFVSRRAQLLNKLVSIDTLLWRLFINNYFHYQLLLHVKNLQHSPPEAVRDATNVKNSGNYYFITVKHFYIFVCTYISTSAVARVCTCMSAGDI